MSNMGMAEKIKELRDKTGVSVMLCKKALEEAAGDFEKAVEVLRRESFRTAENKAERQAKAGIVDAYIHSNKKLGVLVEIRCETDFVAKNKEFLEFSHDIAMQIAASRPENIPSLLAESFIKKPEISVNDYLKEKIQKFGENIEIGRFFIIEV